jgi:hypothetical protein
VSIPWFFVAADAGDARIEAAAIDAATIREMRRKRVPRLPKSLVCSSGLANRMS